VVWSADESTDFLSIGDRKKTEDEVGIGCDKETIVKESHGGSQKDGSQKAYA
jgi:hypothetical protein